MRRLFTLASALSLSLCIALLALWTRSYFARDSLLVTYHARPYKQQLRLRHRTLAMYATVASSLETSRGRMAIVTRDEIALSETPVPMIRIAWELTGPIDLWLDFRFFNGGFNVLGFGHSQIRESIYLFPIWGLTILTALLPAARIGGGIRRRLRRSAMRCMECSYNLTGNTSGVCPECGTPISK